MMFPFKLEMTPRFDLVLRPAFILPAWIKLLHRVGGRVSAQMLGLIVLQASYYSSHGTASELSHRHMTRFKADKDRGPHG